MTASQPRILNVTLTNADTDYQVDLPEGATRFSVQCRTADALRLYYAKGGAFITVKPTPAPAYKEKAVTGSRTFWLQSGAAGKIAEILFWV